MSLRIAFDLDGTLADLRSALDRVAEELFPDAVGVSPAAAGLHEERDSDPGALAPEEEQLEPPELKALTRRQQQQIWDVVRGTLNFWETLGETEPGIVARIAALAEEHRWEVLFITQRPGASGDTTQRQSQRWLAAHGFAMPSVYVLSPSASRGKVAAALSLDAVVDDRAELCLDVKLESKARAFLVARDAPPAAAPNASRLGIEVVESVGQCLDVLSATSREKGGIFGQIRRIFTRTGQA
jgi:hypothetical protein